MIHHDSGADQSLRAGSENAYVVDESGTERSWKEEGGQTGEMTLLPPVRATRVLLQILFENGQPVDAAVGSKAAIYLRRQTGVLRAEASPSGNMELQYDAEQVTLVELGRILRRANLRMGIV
jgi:hypothetical protein